MNSQIDERTSDVEALAKIAKTEPQLAYAACVYGTSKRWCFVRRTAPNIAEHIIYQGCSIKITVHVAVKIEQKLVTFMYKLISNFTIL